MLQRGIDIKKGSEAAPGGDVGQVMDSPAMPELDYRMDRRGMLRRRRGILIGAAILVGAVGMGVYFARPLIERAETKYWMWRCLNYSPPPDEPVPAGTPRCWTELSRRLFTFERREETVYFLHERSGETAGPWLVAVNGSLSGNALSLDEERRGVTQPSWFTLYLDSDVIDPTTRQAAPSKGARIEFYDTHWVKVYPGQADPEQRNHFTLRYDTERGGGIIDCWFKYESYLDAQVRTGPAESD